LEYYELQQESKDRAEFTLRPMGDSFVSLLSGNTPPTYVFECEDKDLRDWVNLVIQRCVLGAGKQVYGVSLEKVMARKSQRGKIPHIITKAVEFIDQNGLDVQGIFRISGAASSLSKYKDELDRGLCINFDDCGDPHVVAGLLKSYFRELPEPVIPFDLFENFMSINLESSTEQITKEIQQLLTKVPADNRKVLLFLCSFLGRVASHAEQNLMHVQNLSLVFGPNLLRPAPSASEAALVQATPNICRLLEIIIENQDQIFTAQDACVDRQHPPPPAVKGAPPGALRLPPIGARGATRGSRGGPPRGVPPPRGSSVSQRGNRKSGPTSGSVTKPAPPARLKSTDSTREPSLSAVAKMSVSQSTPEMSSVAAESPPEMREKESPPNLSLDYLNTLIQQEVESRKELEARLAKLEALVADRLQ